MITKTIHTKKSTFPKTPLDQKPPNTETYQNGDGGEAKHRLSEGYGLGTVCSKASPHIYPRGNKKNTC